MATVPPADGSVTGSATSMIGLMNSAKDKWDSSGGNEAIQRMSSAIPESTKSYVGGLFKREHLRSVSLFFGIGEERPFYVEKVPSLVMERVRHNISFFYLNYILLTAVLFCLTLFISPSAIIGLALLAMAWMWVIRSSQDGSLKIGSVAIPQKTATLIMSGISVVCLLYLLSSIFWWTLFSGGFMVGMHALFRDASMHKDMNDAVAMEGDLNLGESANFLNTGPNVV